MGPAGPGVMWLWYPGSASIAGAPLAGPWSAMVSVPLIWPLFVGGAGEMLVNRSRGKRVVVRVILVSSYMTGDALLGAPPEVTNPENAMVLRLKPSSHNSKMLTRDAKTPDSSSIPESETQVAFEK